MYCCVRKRINSNLRGLKNVKGAEIKRICTSLLYFAFVFFRTGESFLFSHFVLFHSHIQEPKRLTLDACHIVPKCRPKKEMYPFVICGIYLFIHLFKFVVIHLNNCMSLH